MKFNMLTVLSIHHIGRRHQKHYLCRCDCGNEKVIRGDSIKNGAVRSCSCYQKSLATEQLLKYITIHGDTGTRLHRVWRGIIGRCTQKTNNSYSYYGGRGIKVCNEWQNNYLKFKEFALSNGYTDLLQIDRINNNGNYEPSNCRFVTPSENCLNKSNNIKLKAA